MKVTTLAGLLLLAGAIGFLGVIYVAGNRINRDELYVFGGLVGAGLLLLEPGDIRALLERLMDRLPWSRRQE